MQKTILAGLLALTLVGLVLPIANVSAEGETIVFLTGNTCNEQTQTILAEQLEGFNVVCAEKSNGEVAESVNIARLYNHNLERGNVVIYVQSTPYYYMPAFAIEGAVMQSVEVINFGSFAISTPNANNIEKAYQQIS